jgi:hypothetical protein
MRIKKYRTVLFLLLLIIVIVIMDLIMKKIIEAECDDCGGTGVYCGFMEPKGIGVVCVGCNGTGKKLIYYTPFERKRGKRNVQLVQISGSRSILFGGPKGKQVPYRDFKNALSEDDINRLFKE